jgi:cytochrome P450
MCQLLTVVGSLFRGVQASLTAFGLCNSKCTLSYSSLQQSLTLPGIRNKANWGDDAEIWDPDRWLDHRLEQVSRSICLGRTYSTLAQCLIQMTSKPFIFQPFSAGPRICLGQQFAYNNATITLIKLCQRFEKVELAKDVQTEYKPVARIILRWKGGMWVRFHES